MSVKKSKRVSKKVKKINRKKLGLVLVYLKTLKVLKGLLGVIVVIFLMYIVVSLYNNHTISKVKNKILLAYSRLLYKNICANIEINGIERASIERINKKRAEFCELDNKNDMTILLESLRQDPWIKDITIKRRLPDTLQINIEEYLPFALLKYDGGLHLIDENGTVIKIDDNEKRGYYNLLIIAGDGAEEDIYSLFNLLSSNPDLASRLKSALKISRRRWNLILDNGIVVKMPEDNILEAWKRLDKILSINGSEIGLKTIDLRNKDKIYLEENK